MDTTSKVLEAEGYFAVLENSRIEIWDEDGEFCYGSLPGDATEREIRNCMRFYNTGFENGQDCGIERIQRDMRSLLGV